MSENRIIQIYFLFFFVGIILHLVPALSFIPFHITDLFLLTANGIVLLKIYPDNRGYRFFIFFLGSYLLTFFAEATGVETGLVFGEYHYGKTMKLQVLDIPLIIPFNWVVLVMGMTSLFRSTRIPLRLVPFAAAGGLVLFDYTMEPVAVHLDYWTWAGGVIPVQNYIAWFIIAFLISFLALAMRIKLDNKLLKHYVFIQWGFFLVLNVFFRFIDG
jgi:putative membrane protein